MAEGVLFNIAERIFANLNSVLLSETSLLMAEGVRFNIAERIFANLASVLLIETSLLLGFRGQLRKLENTITTIKAVLLDAEKKKETDEQVRMWLEKLEDAIYDVDNLVDELRYYQQQQQRRLRPLPGKKLRKKVRTFLSTSNQLAFRRKIAMKIGQIRQRLDDIIANTVFLQLNEKFQESCVPSPMSWRETHSFTTNDQVIGRDDDRNKILEHFFKYEYDYENKENVSIVSLVGFGGLGKTTLAQYVFNDDSVKHHFDIQAWVYVSDVFDLKLIIQKIIRSATGTSPDQNLDLEQLQNHLRTTILDKRYLLVLDDVCNEDRHKWHGLKTLLEVGTRGSIVLITTRSKMVAKITTHPTKTLMLSGLDRDASLALLERLALEGINVPEAQHGHLKRIETEIALKSMGVPLTIMTIGRLLQSKVYSLQSLEREWKLLRDNVLAKVPYQDDSENIIVILKQSYNNLPSHLKHCFAYCSLFPKNCRINVRQLIKLWMAQGFIKPNRNGSQPEEIGYEYFTILCSGCFLQEAETDKSSGAIEYCEMHDLMHDLASLVAGKSIRVVENNSTTLVENAFGKVRHTYVDFRPNRSSQIPTLLFKQKQISTFILPELGRLSLSDYYDILSNFKFLRALSLRIERNVETLPNRLGRLKHLRYLDLSENGSIKELPSSITELYYLQTLMLINCASLVSLPADIQNLTNLRHLEIRGCYSLTHMPRGIGELRSLQTLDMFVVPSNKSSESGGFDELSKLNNLHGDLNIHIRGPGESGAALCLEQMEFVKCSASSWKAEETMGPGESGAAQCLEDKEHLESLVLSWEVEETMGDIAQEAFKCLRPLQYIKAVKVESYPGEKFPTDWFSSLNSLVRLELSGCKKCKYLPPLDHLSSLQELILDKFSALEYFSAESSPISFFFPSLVKLVIRECVNLKGWLGRERKDFDEEVTEEHQQQQSYFPNLSELEIFDCPLLTSMPLFPNLKKLELDHTSSKPLQETISSAAPSALSNLKDLSITSVDDLQSLPPKPKHNLSSLQSLSISKCSNLASLTEGIRNLRSLDILDCHNLHSLPEWIGSFSSLTHLTIVRCSKLTALPVGIGSLSSLAYLTIVGCSNLTKIPKGICSLPSLEYVNGQKCSEIPTDTLADYLVEVNSPA